MSPYVGRTPLIWAVCMENQEIVEILLNHPKLNVNLGNVHNDTALHKAVLMDNVGRSQITSAYITFLYIH